MKTFRHGLISAVGAALAIFLGSHWLRVERPFDAATVACFPVPSTEGQIAPVKPQLRLVGSEVERRRRVMQTHISVVRKAEAGCTVDACEGGAFKQYRAALSHYLFVRENITRNLFREQGEDGLKTAATIFDTADDAEVIANFKQWYAAGKIQLTDFKSTKETAALLVLKPLDAYRPCAGASGESSRRPVGS
ncbi:MAG: hypothetical protein ACT4OU_07655 [Hyphomicrobium sp.]